MYKDVAKRILASILIFCMIGSTPDLTLLAAEGGTTGSGHTYACGSSTDVSTNQFINDGEYIANAFEVEANTDAGMNAQVLKSVAFALDQAGRHGDGAESTATADYKISIYSYKAPDTAASAMTGTPVAEVSGSYDGTACDSDDYYTVDLPADQQAVLGEGESFVVKVTLSNAYMLPDGSDTSTKSDKVYYKTSADSKAESYVNGVRTSGRAVHIKAETVETSTEVPVTGINITESSASMIIGETQAFDVEFEPASTSQRNLRWTTGDEDIATVDEDGNVTAVSQGTVVITATSEDKPSLSDSITIEVCKDIASADYSVIADQTYQGKAISPGFDVYDGDTLLSSALHYGVTYSNNVNVGTATATVSADGNGYKGTKELTFHIVEASMNSGVTASWTAQNADDYAYTGEEIEIADPAKELTVTYTNRSGDSIPLAYSADGVTGDYVIDSYRDNIEAGNSACAVLKGINNYTGTLNCYFQIYKEITEDDLEVSFIPSFSTYDGGEKHPSVKVKNGTATLSEGTDYTVTYDADMINAGDKTITIDGKGIYAGITKTASFEIRRRNLSASMLTLPNQLDTVTVGSIEGLKVVYGGTTLGKDTDYTVDDVTVADGQATVTVTGINNFTGTVTKTVDVGLDIKNCSVTVGKVTYTGKKLTPKVEVKAADGTTVVDPANYTLTWENNTDAWKIGDPTPTPTVTISGTGEYAGERQETFEIGQKDLATLESGTPSGTISYEAAVLYRKGAAGGIESEVSLTYNGIPLSEGEDYSVAYSGHDTGVTDAAVITVTPGTNGNFTGSLTKNYAITKPYIADMEFTPASIEPQVYDGSAITPAISVAQDGTALVAGTDYTITYDSNTKIGTGYAVITGINNYDGMKEIPFEITAPDIANAKVTPIATQTYTGTAIRPSYTVTLTVGGTTATLTEGTDFKAAYSNNIEAGTAVITLTGNGNYSGTKTVNFEIQKEITHATIDIEAIAAQTYAGKAVEPEVTIKDAYVNGTEHTLIETSDYTLAYADNTAVGTGQVTITGTNGYTGSITKSFRIDKGSLRSDNVRLALKYTSDSVRRFTGSPVRPEIVVTCNGVELKETDDYIVSYSNDINVNSGSTVVIAGGKNFDGIKTLNYDIVPKKINGDTIQVKIEPIDAAELETLGCPKMTITDAGRYSNGESKTEGSGSGSYTLVKNKDYAVGDITVGTDGKAQIEILGINNYGESLTENFTVNQKDIEDGDTEISAALPSAQKSFVYTGEEIIPLPVVTATTNGVTVTLEKDTDYTVATGKIDVGTGYHYTIEFMGKYTGTYTSADTFAITAKDISAADVTVDEIPNQAYTGSPITPEVTVRYNGKTVDAKNYNLSYSNNVNANATAVVTINGTANFVGTRTATFVIRQNIEAGLQVEGLEKVFVYTSKPIEPKVKVTVGNQELTNGTDYTLDFRNNVNAYSDLYNPYNAYVIVKGMGSYGGQSEFPFTISRKNMQDSDIDIEIEDVEFTGGYVQPKVKITYTLADGSVYTLKDKAAADAAGVPRDYDVSIGTSKDVGSSIPVTITPSGINFYSDSGSFSSTFAIMPKSITDADGALLEEYTVSPIADIQYDASEVPYEPEVVLRDRSRSEDGEPQTSGTTYYKLQKNVDYKITYSGNNRPGTATYTIEGIGNYRGTYKGTFLIKANIADSIVSISDQTYTGSAITPEFTVSFGPDMILQDKVDYTYEFENNTNAGTATLRIIGINSYAGSQKLQTFNILPKDIGADDVLMTHVYDSYTYTGEDIHPQPHFTYNNKKLAQGPDFTCTYPDSCSKAGTWYSFTITGKGNYTGTIIKEYKIGDNYNDSRVKVELADGYTFEYTGRAIEPTPRVTRLDSGHEGERLQPNIDYKYEYEDNVDAGTAYVNTWGMPDEFAGDVAVTFEITPKSVEDADITVDAIAAQDYTKEEIKPTPAVFWNGRELIAGEDFEYIYKNNIDAGTATVTVKGIDNFTGEKSVDFTINRKDISAVGSGVTVEDVPEQIYTGSEVTPTPAVLWNGTALDSRTDFAYQYENNTELGTATLTVLGMGNYVGSITKTFNIIKVPLSRMEIEYDDTWIYTGNPIEPAVKISYLDNNGNKVQLDNDKFTITYANTVECGTDTGVITISGNGTYEGTRTCFYTIQQRPLTDATVTFEKIPAQVIDGTTGKAEPKPTLIFRPDSKTTRTLVEPTDYEIVSYSNNTVAGSNGSITIRGVNNFSGTVSQTFYIGEDLKQYIEGIEFKETPEYTYNGTAQMPEITVEMKNGADLVEGRDYEILYDGVTKDAVTVDAHATKAGVHTVSVSGLRPYGGSMELEYTIGKRLISNVEFEIAEQIFTGSEIHPFIVGTDTEANTRLGNADSSASAGEDIGKDDMLVNENAFTVEYPANCTETGTIVLTITATEESNYIGKTEASFEILPKSLEDASVDKGGVIEHQNYTGSPIEPELVLTDVRRNADGGAYNAVTDSEFYTLKEGVDYTVAYSDNIYPGTATMTITGKAPYTGKLTRQFGIVADLSAAVIAPIPPQEYTGLPVTPEITVTLGERTLNQNFDYTVSYSNNTDRGTATVTIHPVGGSMFTGEKTATFEISRELTAETASITMIDTNYAYTGEAITPAIAVTYGNQTLTQGTDYTVSYANNVNVGRATVTVTGTGIFTGSLTANFTIVKRSIIRCTFQNISEQTYTGAATSQHIVVMDGGRTLVENQDYQVAYVNNANPGTATMTISGIGNYGGIKTIRYVVHVSDMTTVRTKVYSKSVKLLWTPVAGASGYAVYNSANKLVARTAKTAFTVKKLKSMKNYSYKVRPYVVSDGVTYYGGFSAAVKVMTKPPKPSVKLRADENRVKITWKKIKGVSGYVVYRSTKKSGSYKKVKTLKKSSITSYTNKNLKSRKKYYYKVRAFKTVNGRKVYSSYSSVKSIRTK